jgi:hypothetical protein
MRLFLIILFLTPFALQAQLSKQRTFATYTSGFIDTNKFQLDSLVFHGPKQLDTLFYEDKKIKAIGYYAIDRQGNKTYLRAGLWTEFYRNGQIMSSGNYDFQFLLGCYNTTAGIRYYSYKKGDWKYFYENGQTKAKGTYKIVRVAASTGVANQFETKSLTTPDWVVNDENGEAAKDRQRVLADLERLHL